MDLSPIVISLKVALISTVIAAVTGTGAAWAMHVFRIPGKNLLETVIGLPLVLPPTVIGFGLLLVFSRNGIIGSFLEDKLHFQVMFTWWAAVIASFVVSLPLMYRSAKAGFESVDKNYERAARTLGSSEWRVFYTVTLPLAWPGVLAGVFLAFARALGEFGATLMLAGNIPGQTQTIPLAIYFAAESGDLGAAGYLVSFILVVSFLITYSLNTWLGRINGVIRLGRGGGNAGSGYQKILT